TPDGHPAQTNAHLMGVVRQAPTPITGRLVLQWEAEGQKKGEDTCDQRLAVCQQVEVGGFVSEIDGNGAVVSRRCGCCAHVSPSVTRSRQLMGHDEGNTLPSQELCEGCRALPRKLMECRNFAMRIKCSMPVPARS